MDVTMHGNITKKSPPSYTVLFTKELPVAQLQGDEACGLPYESEETDQQRSIKKYNNDSLLYQDILSYSLNPQIDTKELFSPQSIFIDFLINVNKEFISDYKSSPEKFGSRGKSHKSRNRKERIRNRLEFLEQLKLVASEKTLSTNKEETVKFRFTRFGKTVALIIKYHSDKNNALQQNTHNEIMLLINQIVNESKDSQNEFFYRFYNNMNKFEDKDEQENKGRGQIFFAKYISTIIEILRDPNINVNNFGFHLPLYRLFYNSNDSCISNLINQTLIEMKKDVPEIYKNFLFVTKYEIERNGLLKTKIFSKFERAVFKLNSDPTKTVIERQCLSCGKYSLGPYNTHDYFVDYAVEVSNNTKGEASSIGKCLSCNGDLFLKEYEYKRYQDYIATNHKIMQILFQQNNDEYTNNAHLFQDILVYGSLFDFEYFFKSRELTRWLLDNNNEFKETKDKEMDKNEMIENRLDRIKSQLSVLENHGLIISRDTQASKGGAPTKEYSLTNYGFVLGFILDYTNNRNYLKDKTYILNLYLHKIYHHFEYLIKRIPIENQSSLDKFSLSYIQHCKNLKVFYLYFDNLIQEESLSLELLFESNFSTILSRLPLNLDTQDNLRLYKIWIFLLNYLKNSDEQTWGLIMNYLKRNFEYKLSLESKNKEYFEKIRFNDIIHILKSTLIENKCGRCKKYYAYAVDLQNYLNSIYNEIVSSRSKCPFCKNENTLIETKNVDLIFRI